MKKQRESFKSQWGFILACIGSSVGMGNIWMFSTRVSSYGGGSFLIPYLIYVALVGFTGVIGEKSNWRATKSGPIAALGIACFAGGTVDAASVKIDETTFPNACVRTYARQQDKNNDGVLSEEEIKAVTQFDWTESANIIKCGVKPGMKINFKGMEVFPNLKEVKINSIFFMKEQMRRCWYLENDDILSQFPYAEY